MFGGGVLSRAAAFYVVLFGSTVLFNYNSIDPNLRVINLPSTGILPEYDFIIVGGGSAGSVLASRLSENIYWKILLLEAGPDENIITDTPILAFETWNSFVDWNYTTVPQKRTCLSTGGQCAYPRGRILGGSSTTNFMVYMRGNKRDYDNWSKNLGLTGWSYEEVLPYFTLSEDNRDFPASKYHGVGGPLTVSRAPYASPLQESYLEAGKELGFDINDPNGAKQTGFSIMQGTLRNGSRCSTAKAFLRPARNRPNLHVLEGAFVTNIILDNSTKSAIGVEFYRGGQKFDVKTKQDVILSAGSINTPQLLMLSGIGPSVHLNSLGISVIKDLPIGNNLHDHAGTPILFRLNESVSITADVYESLRSVLKYTQNGQGPLTSPIGIEAVAFLNSTFVQQDIDYPDIELHLMSSVAFVADNNVQLWNTNALIVHPESRGTLRLRSSNPFDSPLIDPRYFDSEQDYQTAIQAIKYVIAIANTSVFQQMGSTFYQEFYTACNAYVLLSDEHIQCLVDNYSSTIYHPVGTCRMGPASDPRTVVSHETFAVHGINRLRVVDASVIPVIPGGNTNAPVIMIAERAAAAIKKAWYS